MGPPWEGQNEPRSEPNTTPLQKQKSHVFYWTCRCRNGKTTRPFRPRCFCPPSVFFSAPELKLKVPNYLGNLALSEKERVKNITKHSVFAFIANRHLFVLSCSNIKMFKNTRQNTHFRSMSENHHSGTHTKVTTKCCFVRVFQSKCKKLKKRHMYHIYQHVYNQVTPGPLQNRKNPGQAGGFCMCQVRKQFFQALVVLRGQLVVGVHKEGHAEDRQLIAVSPRGPSSHIC